MIMNKKLYFCLALCFVAGTAFLAMIVCEKRASQNALSVGSEETQDGVVKARLEPRHIHYERIEEIRELLQKDEDLSPNELLSLSRELAAQVRWAQEADPAATDRIDLRRIRRLQSILTSDTELTPRERLDIATEVTREFRRFPISDPSRTQWRAGKDVEVD